MKKKVGNRSGFPYKVTTPATAPPPDWSPRMGLNASVELGASTAYHDGSPGGASAPSNVESARAKAITLYGVGSFAATGLE